MTDTPDDGAVPMIDDDAVIWSAPPAELGGRSGRPLLVLLHGYGSDERDLFALAAHLPSEFVVASVRAPLTPPFPTPGWSWFPIEGLHARTVAGVTGAAEAVLAWIDRTVEAGADHPPVPIGLLGFSQGSVIALQALRLRPERFAFAVNLAGYVDPRPLPTDAALATVRPPVFWGRGARDEVIPADRIAHTTEWLPGFVDLSGRVYPGLTHSVSQDELDDVRAFLETRLAELAERDDGQGGDADGPVG